jgi:hypothetical protein
VCDTTRVQVVPLFCFCLDNLASVAVEVLSSRAEVTNCIAGSCSSVCVRDKLFFTVVFTRGLTLTVNDDVILRLLVGEDRSLVLG